VAEDVMQGDPVVVVFFLAIHDIAVGELHTLTTGALGLGVISDADSIEATNVNASLGGFATNLARLTLNDSVGFVTHSGLTKPTGGLSCGQCSSSRGRSGLCSTFGC
jgi:hypothetical protein